MVYDCEISPHFPMFCRTLKKDQWANQVRTFWYI